MGIRSSISKFIVDKLYREKVLKAITPQDPQVGEVAQKAIAQAPGSYSIDQLVMLFQMLKMDFTYFPDPYGKYDDAVYSAGHVVRDGLKGDCDEAAVLTVAAILRMGGSARLLAGWTSIGDAGHAWAEVYVGSKDALKVKTGPAILEYYPLYGPEMSCHMDAVGGCWLSFDILRNRPGAPMTRYANVFAVYKSGYFHFITGYWQ